jgi:hypothetical protein
MSRSNKIGGENNEQNLNLNNSPPTKPRKYSRGISNTLVVFGKEYNNALKERESLQFWLRVKKS